MKKYISWNVNGLRACVKKGFMDFLDEESPDVLCIQETKMQEGQEEIPTPGYLQYWCSAEKKGYSGTLILVREDTAGKLQAVTTGIGIPEHDTEGRVVTAEFDDHYLVTVYTPNSQDGLKRLDYRMEWEDAFRDYLKALETGSDDLSTQVTGAFETADGYKGNLEKDKPDADNTDGVKSDECDPGDGNSGEGNSDECDPGDGNSGEKKSYEGYPSECDPKTFLSGKAKPVIVCGDMNVAHEEIDLKNPKTNRKNAGFSDEERAKMTELLGAGFIDTFRYFYPDVEGVYSWWSYRFNARKNNAGWRIDYFLTSSELEPRLKDARILTDVYGSDHCPVVLDWE